MKLNPQECRIEIFKTNVNTKRQAQQVLKSLQACLPDYCFNFDLDDCDRILRAQSSSNSIDINNIIKIVEDNAVAIDLIEG
jgi:hypothetical protein